MWTGECNDGEVVAREYLYGLECGLEGRYSILDVANRRSDFGDTASTLLGMTVIY